jgi:hypothetical protein
VAQPEAKVKAAIKAAIFKIWPQAWHLMVVPTGFGVGGVPDHLACVPVTITQEMVGKQYGMFIGVEAKTITGKLRGLQRIQIAKIVAADGFCTVTYGVDGVEDLETQLRKRFHL